MGDVTGASSPSIVIRPESSGDHQAICRVVASAFKSDLEAGLVDRIRASPEYVAEMALVAEIDDEIVGHVMISGAVIRRESGERKIVMLSPLAVAPPRQREGIGGSLVRAAIAIAEARREPLVVLEGDPAYYGRFGFEHAARYGIKMHLPEWAPPEAAQVVLFPAFDPEDPSLCGTVDYPRAFDGLE